MPRAARRCSQRGCDELVPCGEHARKAWASSDRRSRLPGDWSSSIVPAVLRLQPVCQLAYPGEWWTSKGPARCTRKSTEVDHIGSDEDHSVENLRGVCSACHRRRTQRQSAAARRRS